MFDKDGRTRVGPFFPDCTNIIARHGGRVVAIERSAGSPRTHMWLVLGGQRIGDGLDSSGELAEPVRFHTGISMGIAFESDDVNCEAWLWVDHG